MFEFLYSGAAGALLGALVGAWISVRLNFSYQKRLLQQQLHFQQQLLDQQLVAQEKTHKEYLDFLQKSHLDNATGGHTLRTVIHNEAQEIKQAIEALKK